MSYDDPCNSCQYMSQACAYILDGKQFEDACIGKRRWLMYQIRKAKKEE